VTNEKQQPPISGMRLRTLSATLAFAVLLAVAGTQAVQAQTFKILHTFGKGTDGQNPYGDLLLDAAGNIYGTTDVGGAHGVGTVYKLDRRGKETMLYSFTGNIGDHFPAAGLIQDKGGNFYGTTSGTAYANECSPDCGSVFKLSKNGLYTVLHIFTGPDGALPEFGSLVRDASGNLFGSTLYGGDLSCNNGEGCGVVFKVSKTGKYTLLHSFKNGTDGASPLGSLVLDPVGNPYGTAANGGNPACRFGCGVVFKVNQAGKFNVVYGFPGQAHGSYPSGGMVRDQAGNLYGVSGGGGDLKCNPDGCGVVFKLDTRGKETVLYRFPGGAAGEFPSLDLARDAAGNLYGKAFRFDSQQCKKNGCPIVFKLDASGKETVLYTFTQDLEQINGGVALDSAGNVLGATTYGGVYRRGVVFKIKP
jgi:uncharacterized repeat protein (TIGR03803 family)